MVVATEGKSLRQRLVTLAGACVGLVLAALIWTGQVPRVLGLSNEAHHLPPDGFTIQDPLDPAMKTGYRHPYYLGYVAPYDRMFPTGDPLFARYAHRQYGLQMNQNAGDTTLGWVSVRLPDGIVEEGADALRPAACRVFREVIAEPHHAGYQHLLIALFDDAASLQFDLRRPACGL